MKLLYFQIHFETQSQAQFSTYVTSTIETIRDIFDILYLDAGKTMMIAMNSMHSHYMHWQILYEILSKLQIKTNLQLMSSMRRCRCQKCRFIQIACTFHVVGSIESYVQYHSMRCKFHTCIPSSEDTSPDLTRLFSSLCEV